ncbi:MAG: amino acid ABC transporter permease [Clostridiaceae bacterium]
MRFHFKDIAPYLIMMLKGIGVNFTAATIALLFGIILGLCAYSAKKSTVKPLQIVANAYIEIVRNTPLLVQLYLIYFGIAQMGINMTPLQSTMIAMIFNSGAYISEIMRSGFQSVSSGTIEAGHALGMSNWQVFTYIRLKPAFRSAFPALINQYVLMFLGSTVASTISLHELMYQTLYIESVTARTVEAFLITGVLFYVSSFIIINILRKSERIIFKW